MRFGLIILIVIASLGFIFWKDIQGTVKELSSDKDTNSATQTVEDPAIRIVQQWDLPGVLREVSGIAYLDADRFACVQDEEGVIYIYNKSTNRIEKEIDFASPGDFEGLTVHGSTAWVVRADGVLFEVDMNKGRSSVKQYKTPLTVSHNVEGLCYDKDHQRLLLALKDDEPGGKDDKGIYAFDLKAGSLVNEPVYILSMNHPLLQNDTGKKNKKFKPSALGIHPLTKEIYVTDGPGSRLLRLDKNGEPKQVVMLGKKFRQPEGITFGAGGEIFISNEGKDEPGNIMQVEIQ